MCFVIFCPCSKDVVFLHCIQGDTYQETLKNEQSVFIFDRTGLKSIFKKIKDNENQDVVSTWFRVDQISGKVSGLYIWEWRLLLYSGHTIDFLKTIVTGRGQLIVNHFDFHKWSYVPLMLIFLYQGFCWCFEARLAFLSYTFYECFCFCKFSSFEWNFQSVEWWWFKTSR